MYTPPNTPLPTTKSGGELLTKEYWESSIQTHAFCCELWRTNFDAFYADVGARPHRSAFVVSGDAMRPMGPNNFKWVAKGGRPLNTNAPTPRKGPTPKLDEPTVREILELGHTKGLPPREIVALFPEATLKDVQDALAGRRYIVKDYNYLIHRTRLNPSVTKAVIAAHLAGASPLAIASRYELPIKKVYWILSR